MHRVTADRIGLLVNPTAGRHRGEQVGTRVADLLEAAGREVIDLTGLDAARAEAKARAAIAGGDIDLLVVAGGDGAAGLGANLCADTDVPLGVVAVGTGNDNARELGLPVHDVAASVERILAGGTRRIDLGRVTTTGGEHVRDFLGVLSCGFDAVVNERANRMVWPRGPQRYNLAILRELPVFGPIHYELTIDGREREIDGMLVCIANGRAFGGGMKVAPGADVEDGLLDVVIVHDLPMHTFLSVFPKVFKGTHTSHPAVETIRGARVTLATDRIVTYADGERVAPLPLTVEAAPGALSIVH
ncbi:YegS/Rv2252/BmrU family lipid kinase [Janibacter terrae]|uniref:YegS/Rv2252/BmrU family lipid kinase n=1 Tax=Janibacter terrae TaxID=103817 RepID=A0ABZ2FE03_9MICO|nr:YegS/Rv2252/BmrU family lipid kinase [Janibacter terrae]MBA4085867.1 sphingosine kinase [Kytococcus sp.]HCE60655.1 sphingosine kinase [Janibacter terrae]